VVVNCGAGTVERLGADAVRQTLETAFAEAGMSAELSFIDGKADVGHAAKQAAEQAARGEIDAVVVGGGDGTVRTVAALLAGTRTPLGVLPLGTLNHFARDLGMPLDLAAAVRAIAGFQAEAVDIAEVNGTVFINNSSIGIYPHMVAERKRRHLPGRVGKWVAMTLASLRALRLFPRRRLVVHAEGAALPCRTPCLLVGNNAYEMDFLSLGTRKHLDGGKLHLYVARSATPPAFLWLGLRAVLGLVRPGRDLDTITATSAEVTSRASRLLVAFDGEVETMATPLCYRIRPRGLQVLVPVEA